MQSNVPLEIWLLVARVGKMEFEQHTSILLFLFFC